MADDRHWSWWAIEVQRDGATPERWALNEPTREGVIAAARREYGPTAIVSIVEATQDGPFTTDLFDEYSLLIDDLLEDFAEANAHRFGEDGFDGDVPRDELAAALNAAVAGVIGKHAGSICTFRFTGTRNLEIIYLIDHAAPVSPLAGARAGEAGDTAPRASASPDPRKDAR